MEWAHVHVFNLCHTNLAFKLSDMLLVLVLDSDADLLWISIWQGLTSLDKLMDWSKLELVVLVLYLALESYVVLQKLDLVLECLTQLSLEHHLVVILALVLPLHRLVLLLSDPI